MATTIRVYLDGGGTAYASAAMNADRTFSVSLASVPAGTHTFEVTAQEDGKGESARVIQTVVVERGAQQTHPLAADIIATGVVLADLTAPGAPTQHALQATISAAATVAADLTVSANTSLEASISASATTGADLTAPGQQGGGSISLVAAGAAATTAANSITPAVPSGIQDGDLMVLVVGCSTPANFSVSGWTVKYGTSRTIAVLYRRVSGSESAPTINVNSGGAAAFIFALRGAVASGDPFEAASDPGPVSDVSQAVPGITTLTAGAWAVALGWFLDFGNDDLEGGATNSGAAFVAATGAATTEIRKARMASGGSTVGLGAWYSEKASPGATGSATVAASPGGDLGTSIRGVLVAVKPA